MKKGIIILLVLVVALVVAWHFYGDQLKALMGTDGAFDANDRLTFNKMKQTIADSQFASDLPYILDSYNNGFAPGRAQAPTDDYGTIQGKSTMSSGLTSAVWKAFLSLYDTTATVGYPTPKYTAAKALATDIAHQWEAYKTNTIQKIYG